jgi:hypothetical protein
LFDGRDWHEYARMTLVARRDADPRKNS